MSDYLGYGLKGFAGGLQSGISMAMNIQELKWKKKQQKLLEGEKEKIQEAFSLFKTQNKEYFDSLDAGGYAISSEGVDVIATAFTIKEAMGNAMTKIILARDQGDRETEKQAHEYLMLLTDYVGKLNLKGGSAKEGWGIKNIVGEEDLKYFKALDTMRATPASKVTPGMVGDVSALTGAFGQETITGIRTQPITEAPTMTDEKSAISILRVFTGASPEIFEKKRTDLESKTGLDLSNYTQDILREAGTELYNLYDTPSEVMANVKAPAGLTIIPKRDTKAGKYYASFSKKAITTTPGGRVTSLPLQESYKQKALDANTWTDAESIVNRYAKAGYDTSEMPEEQDWINAKLGELDTHIEMLDEITDAEGRLIGGKKFKFMSGDEAVSQTGEVWYRDVYEAYIFYLEELRKMGVDVTRYPKIKAPEEVKKTFWGKYPSIYSTETVPTPIPTETPKLPLTP